MNQYDFLKLGIDPNATKEQIEEAYQNKIAEINFLFGDRSHAVDKIEKLTKVYQRMLKNLNKEQETIQSVDFEFIDQNMENDLMSEDESDVSIHDNLSNRNEESCETEKELFLSFEEIFRGGNKRITVNVTELDGSIKSETICLKLPVGIAPGTRIPFPLLCNPIGIPANLVIVVRDKANQRFKRTGPQDIEYTAQITKEQSETDFELLIPTLENDPISLSYEDEITDDMVEVFAGRGLPKVGNKRVRGNLVVRFEIVDQLTKEPHIYEQFTNEQPVIEVRRVKVPEVFTAQEEINQESIDQKEKPKKKLGPIEQKMFINLEQILTGTHQNVTVADRQIMVPIPPGIESGTEITVEEAGNQQIDCIPGDVIFTVYVRDHLRFQRKGNDLLYFSKVLKEHLQSNEPLKIPTLEGDFLDLVLDDTLMVKKGTKFFGRGLPSKENGQLRGDLIVTLEMGKEFVDEIHLKPKVEPLVDASRFDIEFTAKLTTKEAICGGEISIPSFDGSFKFKFNGGKTIGSSETIPQRGHLIPGCSGQRGNLTVKFDIIFDQQPELQDPPIVNDLSLTLEQILKGCVKKIKINRQVIDPVNGPLYEDKIFKIQIPPGTESGKRFTFPREGDQNRGTIPADIVFIVREKAHASFTRKGTHLIHEVEITQSQLHKGGKVAIPTLGSTEVEYLSLDGIVDKRGSRRFPNQGLPFLEDNSSKRGDLIINYQVIEDPQDPAVYNNLELTLEQIDKGCVKKLKISRSTFDSANNELSTEKKIITIDVKPGTETGKLITFSKTGDKYPDRQPADLVFVVTEKAHPKFQRKDANLIYSVNVTESEARKGLLLDIPKLDGTYLKLQKKQIKVNTVHTFPGHGLPLHDNPHLRGDLYVRFFIMENKFKDEPLIKTFPLTLEQILRGCKKNEKFTRYIYDASEAELAREERTLYVEVPLGATQKRITFPHFGHVRPGRVAADVVYIVEELEHPHFKRNGSDLEYKCDILESKALLGGPIEVPTIDGQMKILHIDRALTEKNATRTLVNLGMPTFEKSNKRGNLIVKFNIIKDIVKRDNLPSKKVLSNPEKLSKGKVKLMVQNAEEATNGKVKHILEQQTQIFDLPLCLHDVLAGNELRQLKKIKIYDQKGDFTEKEEEFKIQIKPGTKAGQEFLFVGSGDRHPNEPLRNVVFLTCDVPHAKFTREGKDLCYTKSITQLEARGNSVVFIPALDGSMIQLPLEDPVGHNSVKAIPGYGLPDATNNEEPGKLLVKLEIMSEDMEIDPEICKPEDRICELALPLEDFLNGKTTMYNIERQAFDNNFKVRFERKKLKVIVAPGTLSGRTYRFNGEGDRFPGQPAGDIVVVIREVAHQFFERNGAHLVMTVDVPAKMAKKKLKMKVPLLDGIILTVKLKKSVTEESSIIIPDFGFPISENSQQRGDIIVHFRVIPDKSKEHRNVIQTIFGGILEIF